MGFVVVGRTQAGNDQLTGVTAPPIDCVSNGPCISSLSTSTPKDGQALTITGSDFVNVTTTSWVPPFSNDLNVHSFEGTHFQSLSTLGFTTAGLGNYITTSASVRGQSSAYFHSLVPDASRTTCAMGQGAGQSYSRFDFDDSINEDVWVRTYMQIRRPGNYPTNFTKWMEVLQGAAYFQNQNGVSLDGTPTNLILDLVDPNYPAGQERGATTPIDSNGGPMRLARWYHFRMHVRRIAPNPMIALWIDGQPRYALSLPAAWTSKQKQFLFGIINACHAATDTRQGHGWDLERFMDEFVVSSRETWPTEIWLCPDAGANPSSGLCVWLVPDHIEENQITVTFRKTQGRGRSAVRIRNGTRYVKVYNQARVLSNAFPVQVS
jgi:hypothetical protein